jgi:hypothetical protein
MGLGLVIDPKFPSVSVGLGHRINDLIQSDG